MALVGLGWRVPATLSDNELAERRAAIVNLSPAEKQQLLKKQERFIRLPAEQQARIRRLYQDLQDDPRGEELRGVLVRYSAWLKTLTTFEQASLAECPTIRRGSNGSSNCSSGIRHSADSGATAEFLRSTIARRS